MVVGAPDAHVLSVLEVRVVADVESLVHVLQFGVVQDLLRIGDVLLDGPELVVRTSAGPVVHPSDLRAQELFDGSRLDVVFTRCRGKVYSIGVHYVTPEHTRKEVTEDEI